MKLQAICRLVPMLDRVVISDNQYNTIFDGNIFTLINSDLYKNIKCKHIKYVMGFQNALHVTLEEV